MQDVTKNFAEGILKNIVGQPFQHGDRYQELNTYGFDFGLEIDCMMSDGTPTTVNEYAIHSSVPYFELIDRKRQRGKEFYHDTPYEVFCKKIEPLVGLEVKRIGLNDKNDLWIDLGDYWMVLATVEDGEESWRFFSPATDKPHLVASDSWICLRYD